VAHGCGFGGCDETEIVEVKKRPEVVEPLWKLGRSDFKKVLVQATWAAAPEFDGKSSGPREKHIAILHDVFSRQFRVASVGTTGVIFAELGDFDDG
jgi:hypothetical protein